VSSVSTRCAPKSNRPCARNGHSRPKNAGSSDFDERRSSATRHSPRSDVQAALRVGVDRDTKRLSVPPATAATVSNKKGDGRNRRPRNFQLDTAYSALKPPPVAAQ